MKNVKFELPEGRWLVTVKNGQTKIKSMEGYITFKEESFLEVKARLHSASKEILEAKKII